MDVQTVKVVFLSLLFACGFCTRALYAQQSCALTISLPDPVVKSGTEVIVQIALSNTSRQDIVIAKSRGSRAAFSGFVFRVTDRNGNPAVEHNPDKERGKSSTFKLDGVLKGSRTFVTLKPGEHVEQKIGITSLYDLTPGIYVIQVERADEEGVTFTRSNKVTLTVTE